MFLHDSSVGYNYTCSIIWYNSTERYIERLDTRLRYTFNQIIVYIVASNKMLINFH